MPERETPYVLQSQKVWQEMETLEPRTFFSACPVTSAPSIAPAPEAITMSPMANVKRMPRKGDVFKGTSSWREEGHNVSVRVTMKVIRVVRSGEYKVQGTSPDDRTAKYNYSVHMKKNGSFTFEYSGHNYYGSDYGEGYGRLSTDGKTLSGKNTSSQNSGMVSFKLARQ